jgi:hypothetical protein
MKLNGTQQQLAYADDVNLLENNRDNIQEKKCPSEKVGLGVNA